MASFTISAKDALDALSSPETTALDVRSPGEFADGFIPGFSNGAILNDDERHLVGLCYKQRGQDEAIRLGHELVDPDRARRVGEWSRSLSGGSLRLVTCWRGGLRSQLACSWLGEAGVEVRRVVGGYKEMRRELLHAFASLPREVVVISGPTGSGKTALLGELRSAVCLETLAHHRGSSFGGMWQEPQPRQASFENALALRLRRLGSRLVIEDESRMIGRLVLPDSVIAAIGTAPVVRVDMPAAERALRLVEEYVGAPFARGVSPGALLLHYEDCLANLHARLGGLASARIRDELHVAFTDEASDISLHQRWILSLLELYYDKRYEFSYEKLKRPLLFQGDWSSCRSYLTKFA